MSSDSHPQIPTIDLSILSQVDRGTDQWYHLCKKVREACENYGCFELLYDKIPQQLRAETFSVSKQLFSLPVETKKENLHVKLGKGYHPLTPSVPLYESFGFEEPSNYEALNSLTKHLPDGHDKFCTVLSMIKQFDELKDMINLMILDSYGLGEKSDSLPASNSLLRTMKYRAPPTGEYTMGNRAHTDKSLSTILCEDQVSGLEVETKDGQWIKLQSLSPTSYVYFVGDFLMAWSNGRMHAVKHRVMVCGDKDRYSLGIFSSPIDGATVEVQKELIDEEYPRVFKDIDYIDFYNFIQKIFEEKRIIGSEKLVYAFAGISN